MCRAYADQSPQMKVFDKKLISLVLPSAIAATVFLWLAFYGPQTVFYFEYRPRVRHPELFLYRGLDAVPRPLEETNASTAEGTTLSYFGYHFEVPYNGIAHKRESMDDVEIRFETGQVVRLLNPEASRFYNILVGDEESKYEQFKAVMSATPAQLSPVQPRRKFERMLALIDQKARWFEHNVAAPDIFYFATSNLRGFETSGISGKWQDVGLTIFDAADRVFVIRVKGDDRAGVKLFQAEINRIIRTFEAAGPCSLLVRGICRRGPLRSRTHLPSAVREMRESRKVRRWDEQEGEPERQTGVDFYLR
jgi:hypothetical protein